MSAQPCRPSVYQLRLSSVAVLCVWRAADGCATDDLKVLSLLHELAHAEIDNLDGCSERRAEEQKVIRLCTHTQRQADGSERCWSLEWYV